MTVPENIQNLANKVRSERYGKDVRESIAQSIETTGETAKDAKDRSIEQMERVDTLIQENPQPSEVVDARGNHPILRDRLNSIDQNLAQTEQELIIVDDKATDAQAKANNPLEALSIAGYKIPLDDLSNEVKDAMTGTTGITTAKGYFENNRGVDFPLKNMTFRGTLGTISELAKNVILDVKIFGAKVDCYYKLDMVANGNTSNGKERWGITLTEYRKSDFASTGYRTQYVFIYNDDTLAGNEQNANYAKGSDFIDTITVDNGEIACSVTVDRSALTNLGLQFINLGSSHAPTAIVDPSNYFF